VTLILFTFSLQPANLGFRLHLAALGSHAAALGLYAQRSPEYRRPVWFIHEQEPGDVLASPKQAHHGSLGAISCGRCGLFVGRRRSTDKEKFPRDGTLGNAPALPVPRKKTALTIADDQLRSVPGLSRVANKAGARDARTRCGTALLGYSVSLRSPKVFLGLVRFAAVEGPRGADPAV
jgi:hypothetical protein